MPVRANLKKKQKKLVRCIIIIIISRRRINTRTRGEFRNTYQPPDDKETKQIWGKIWERREHNRKIKWITNIGKDIEGLEEKLKAKIRLVSLRATLQKVRNWKTPGHG